MKFSNPIKPMASLRCGQLSGFAAAVLFGCSAPLISTFTASGSSLSIAGLLYAGTTLALAIVRLMKGRTQDESPLQRRDAPALAGLILLGGIVGPVALVHGLARLPAASSSLLLNLGVNISANAALRQQRSPSLGPSFFRMDHSAVSMPPELP